MRHPVRLAAIALPLLIALAGCAGPGRLVEVPAGQTEIGVTARSFSFDPEQIVVRAGGTLTLRVRNVSASDHNLTVTDPDGGPLGSTGVPAGQTAVVEVPVRRPGVYRFHCAQPFHSTLGMEGRIEAR